jgi:hypothetical protein
MRPVLSGRGKAQPAACGGYRGDAAAYVPVAEPEESGMIAVGWRPPLIEE